MHVILQALLFRSTILAVGFLDLSISLLVVAGVEDGSRVVCEVLAGRVNLESSLRSFQSCSLKRVLIHSFT